MNYPQNPANPEVRPVNTGGPITPEPSPPENGQIEFNSPPLLSGDPRSILARAEAAGDTTQKRVKQFHEAVFPDAPQQK